MVKFSSSLESFSWRWAGRLWFLAIFPSLLYRLLTFPFIPACVHCPSSTCRFKLSKTDTCPISSYSKSLEVVVKAKECGSVRCRVLNGSKGSFPLIFFRFSFKLSPIPFLSFCPVGLWVLPRTELSSAVSQGYLVLYIYRAWAIALLGLDLWIPHG